MEPTELLRLVGEQLDRIGCQRFTTGSVASMIAVQGVASIDWPYLEHWAERLGVAAELDLVRTRP
jgi:hypothetical protein